MIDLRRLSPALSRLLVAPLAVAAVASCSAPADPTASPLGRSAAAATFDIDLAETSVSGLSSGAFMAVQLQVAFSSSMRGAAVFAGGPFACSGGTVSGALTRCMRGSPSLDTAALVAVTKSMADRGAVDPVAYLAGQRVFLFGGAEDDVVAPAVMDALRDYYAAFVAPDQIRFERRRPGTGHTMPTVNEGGECAASASPYLGACGYDGAGEALAHLYGPLSPPADALSGTFLSIRQGDFVTDPSAHSLADTARAYVPRACAEGARCRVHVALHGCLQSESHVGDAFYARAGYNRWADTNRIVVLYPQTVATAGKNPNGCWDWWGYDSPDYASRAAPQMRAIMSMVEALAAGRAGPAPADAGQVDAARDGAPPAAEECVRASNAAHVEAGRARAAFGLAFATGSGQALGLHSARVTTSLRELAPRVWVRALCR